ncbi:MAG: diaminopimelate dehydrogenase [Clostridia bacterium]|nr:diaminopimelate dehydrogenase [Clostridia bacterium]
MKINIGIIGYGNLGKAVERIILSNPSYNLVAIFSRRTITSPFKTLIEPLENILIYKKKIDVMLMCGGSFSDIEIQAPEIAKNFNTINSFDTHSKIPTLHSKLNKICKENKTISIMSCGWDPGIFSIIRAMFYAITKNEPTTFWGKGISMGHSDAIRQVEGVDDGVEFTIPNIEKVKQARNANLTEKSNLHFRECFVNCKKEHQAKVEYAIKNIPNYFKGEKTIVNFVSGIELLKIKQKLMHKGEVMSHIIHTNHEKSSLEFRVKMSSNPDFTASVMTAYIQAIVKLSKTKSYGSFTCLDIPISFLFNNYDKLIQKFC